MKKMLGKLKSRTPKFRVVTSKPVIGILWSPEILNDDEYATLVVSVGDLVRSHGGVGVKRLRASHAEISVDELASVL